MGGALVRTCVRALGGYHPHPRHPLTASPPQYRLMLLIRVHVGQRPSPFHSSVYPPPGTRNPELTYRFRTPARLDITYLRRGAVAPLYGTWDTGHGTRDTAQYVCTPSMCAVPVAVPVSVRYHHPDFFEPSGATPRVQCLACLDAAPVRGTSRARYEAPRRQKTDPPRAERPRWAAHSTEHH